MKNIFGLVEKLNGCERIIVGDETASDIIFDCLLKIDIKTGAMKSVEKDEARNSYKQKDTIRIILLSTCEKTLGKIERKLP